MKIYVIVCLSLILITSGAAHSETTDILTLAAGSEKGVYYPLGQGIVDAAKKSGLKIYVLSSQGSLENLYWLSKDKAQLCIAQSDTVYEAYNGVGHFKEKLTNIQVITSLYIEAVHILVRNPLHIKKIEDFRAKRISIGPEGSGTEFNARAILEAAGITSNEIQLLHLSFEDAIKALTANKVDIVFFTSGFPSDAVRIITQNKSASFFEPNSEILHRLIDTYPFFVIATIPSNTYTDQDEEITTVGVAALLLNRTNLDNHLIYVLTKSIFSNTSLIANYHVKGHDINLSSAFKGVAIPINEGAKQFYDEKGIYRIDRYKKIMMNYGFPALLIFVLIIVLVNLKKIRFHFKKREIARVVVALVLLWFLGSIILFYSEHKINENYSNLSQAFWSALINWISFGAREPFTYIGRITAITMMILGIGGLTWFTGTIASVFIHKKLMGGKKMFEKLYNHYIIINWNDKALGIIKQLRSPDLQRKPILIITDQKESPIPLEYEYDDVIHVGGAISEVLLKKANVHKAHSVIILADVMSAAVPKSGNKPPSPKSKQVADYKTILAILAVRKICDSNDEKGRKQVPIIAEILKPEEIELAKYAGVFGDGSVEIVSSEHVAQNLLAQVAVTPGLTKIYNDLLTFGKSNSEMYGCKIPSKFIGKTINEFFKWVINLRDKDFNIVPIAISRKGKIFINPSNSDIKALENDDTFFAICDAEADLKKLESFNSKKRGSGR